MRRVAGRRFRVRAFDRWRYARFLIVCLVRGHDKLEDPDDFIRNIYRCRRCTMIRARYTRRSFSAWLRTKVWIEGETFGSTKLLSLTVCERLRWYVRLWRRFFPPPLPEWMRDADEKARNR